MWKFSYKYKYISKILPYKKIQLIFNHSDSNIFLLWKGVNLEVTGDITFVIHLYMLIKFKLATAQESDKCSMQILS